MLDEILIKFDDTIYDAFSKLQKTKLKCLIVTDYKKKLLGTLTDGDLRRALLKKIKINSKIKNFFKKKMFVLFHIKFG